MQNDSDTTLRQVTYQGMIAGIKLSILLYIILIVFGMGMIYHLEVSELGIFAGRELGASRQIVWEILHYTALVLLGLGALYYLEQ